MTTIAVDGRMLHSSGIGTIICNVLPRMMAARPSWHIQFLGNPSEIEKMEWAKSPNFEVVPFTAPLYSIGEQIKWPRSALKKAEFLWSPNYNVPLLWHSRLLVNVNDVAHLALPDVYGGLVRTFYANTMFNQVRRRADGIIYISEFTRSEFSAWVGKPVRAAEYVVHCGVDDVWFHIPESDVPYSKPYILFVGNVKPHKNLRRLLEAFDSIKNNIPHDLMIVGRKDGLLTGDPEVISRVEGMLDRVHFTGRLPDEELRRIFAHADVLALPSLYEGFGLPPLEGMAAGCPAVVSRAASLPEVCGDAAVYCDPLDVSSIAEALKGALTDQALRAMLKINGARRAKELSWDRSADGYLRAMDEMLGGASARTGGQ